MIKVNRVYAQNYQRLKTVELVLPERGPVHVTGPNGAGKSSLLDAILAALGGAGAAAKMPIRAGENEAEIRVETTEFTVIRRFKMADDGKVTLPPLIVESKDGARYPSPQRMLDRFWKLIAFDPHEFAELDDAEQYAQLRAIVPLAVDPDHLEGLNRTDFDNRADRKREAATLRAQASGIHYPDGLPQSEIDVSELTQRQQSAIDENAARERRLLANENRVRRQEELHGRAAAARAEIDQAIADIRRAGAGRVNGVEVEIDRLRRRIAELEHERTEIEAGIEVGVEAARRSREETAERAEAEAAALAAEMDDAIPEPVDISEISGLIQQAAATNAAIAERRRRETMEAEAAAAEREAEEMTVRIDERKRQIREAVEAAEMPIEGLGFSEKRVMWRGVPFRQASAAERLRVSAAVGMKINPDLRLMILRDGALLDDDSMAVLTDMTTGADFQIIVESIDPSGKVGIYLEEGEVAEVLTPEVAEATRRPARARRDKPAPQGGLL